MAIKGVFYVYIEVSDLARSKKFYGETLGWQLGTDEKEVAGFSFGSGYLVMHGGTKPAPSNSMHVSVQIDNAQEEYERLKGIGLKVSDFYNQPWGEQSFSFRDPDGHLWYYSQSTR